MNVSSPGEALFIACEMEKRAIRLYERALILFPDGFFSDAVRQILGDEKKHLEQFARMGADAPDFERGQLLSAQASQFLFSGGLMEAQRKGAFQSVQALYAYAAEEEKNAAGQYGAFAAQLTGKTAAAFSAIALEEGQHLKRLNEMLSDLSFFCKGTKQP